MNYDRAVKISLTRVVTLLGVSVLSGGALSNPLAEDKNISTNGNHPFKEPLNKSVFMPGKTEWGRFLRSSGRTTRVSLKYSP